MNPGAAAVGRGAVWHRRSDAEGREVHAFSEPVLYAWLDLDRPDELCRHHPLWSTGRWRPVQFRRQDYLDGASGPIGHAVSARLATVLGREPGGPVRTLTQPRVWGWLFNPITVHVAWDDPDGPPVGAVVEVTNTPWKERQLYAVALHPAGTGVQAVFDKSLHVSPFLDEDHRYHLRLDVAHRPQTGRHLLLAIDVHPATAGGDDDLPVVETVLDLDLLPPTRKALTCALTRLPLSTHRVSLAIHVQAARLARKGVEFIPHPSKRPTSTRSTSARTSVG